MVAERFNDTDEDDASEGSSAQELHQRAVYTEREAPMPEAPRQRAIPSEGLFFMRGDVAAPPLKEQAEKALELDDDDEEDEAADRPTTRQTRSEESTESNEVATRPILERAHVAATEIEWPEEDLDAASLPSIHGNDAGTPPSERPIAPEPPTERIAIPLSLRPEHAIEMPAPEDAQEPPAHVPAPPYTPPRRQHPLFANKVWNPGAAPTYNAQPSQPNAPPSPPRPPRGGGRPPVPPPNMPPASPGGFNPNMPGGSGGNTPHFNMYPNSGSIQYNQVPVAPVVSANRQPSVHAVDPFARLVAVGAWFRAGRKGKKLGREISSVQKDTQAHFAHVQSNQYRMEQVQKQQGEQLRRLQTTQESRPVYVPFAEQPSSVLPTRPAEAAPLAAPLPKIEARPPMPAVTEQQVQELQEQADDAQQNERIVQDAWRRYKVDSHNREIVDDAERGAALIQEQRAELQGYKDPTLSPTGQGNGSGSGGVRSTAGGAASVPQQSGYGPIPPYPVLANGMTNPSLPPGQPTHIDPQHQLPPQVKKPTSGAPGPVFWVMLAVILAAFFAAALI